MPPPLFPTFVQGKVREMSRFCKSHPALRGLAVFRPKITGSGATFPTDNGKGTQHLLAPVPRAPKVDLFCVTGMFCQNEMFLKATPEAVTKKHSTCLN